MLVRLTTLLLLTATGCSGADAPWAAPSIPEDRIEPLALAPAPPPPVIEPEPETRALSLRVAGSHGIKSGDWVDVLATRAVEDERTQGRPELWTTSFYEHVRVQSIGPVVHAAEGDFRDVVLIVPVDGEHYSARYPLLGLPTLAGRARSKGRPISEIEGATLERVLTGPPMLGERYRSKSLEIIRKAAASEP